MDSEIVKEVLALLIRSQVLAEELDLPEFKIPQHIVYAGAAVQAIDLLRGHPDGWYAVDLCARSLLDAWEKEPALFGTLPANGQRERKARYSELSQLAHVQTPRNIHSPVGIKGNSDGYEQGVAGWLDLGAKIIVHGLAPAVFGTYAFTQHQALHKLTEEMSAVVAKMVRADQREI